MPTLTIPGSIPDHRYAFLPAVFWGAMLPQGVPLPDQKIENTHIFLPMFA
jgi:hypothetical protein